MRRQRLILGTFAAPLCIALAACGSNETAGTAADATSEPEAQAEDVTISSDAAPASEASKSVAMASPVEKAGDAATKDPSRGKDGLEEKCHARVAKETGLRVIGTNRIDESEAAIEIYVNTDGSQALWNCHGYKNGTIDEVPWTGSDAAL